MSEEKKVEAQTGGAPAPEKKKKHTKLKICLGIFAVVVVIGLLFVLVSLQERPASAAEVDSAVLSQQGWAQTGVVGKSSMDVQQVLTLKINTAMLNYTDTRLGNQINTEKNRIVNTYKTMTGDISIPDVSMGQSSSLATVRIMPPMIADFLKGPVVKIASDQLVPMFESMMMQSGVQNFRKTGEMQLTVKGKSVTASVYEGSLTVDMSGNSVSINLKGILAVWATDNGIVAAVGVTPSGKVTYNYNAGSITVPFSFDFDTSGANGGSEFNELVKLVEGTS
jgi:hypothetical protein